VLAGMAKAMPTEPPEGEKMCRVHANDVAVHIEGGPTGITLVDRSIDLNEVVVWAGADVTPSCRDDAGSNGAAQSKRVADSQNPVPDSGAWSESFTNGKSLRPSTLIRATSVRGSVPITFAAYVFPLISRDLDRVGLVHHVVISHRHSRRL